MNLSQTQNQKQVLKYSPLQIQLLNLLQLNSLAIEQKIKDEIEENPALEEGKEEEREEESPDSTTEAEESEEKETDFDIEEYFEEDDIPYYKTQSSNMTKDDDVFPLMVTQRTTFQDQLKEQLQSFKLSERVRKIACYLIDSLDEDGYLRTPVSDLTNDFSFAENMFAEEEEVLEALKFVQKCDPPGVGARTLRESLLIQLQRKTLQDKVVQLATKLLTDYFHEFSNKNYEKIMRESSLSNHELQEALHVIVHLNPKPNSSTGREDVMANTIIPEFLVAENNGKFEISLNNQQIPELRLSKKFVEMIDQIKDENKSHNKKTDRSVIQFARQKINSAKWFIDAIQQRQSSMLRTMEAIVHIQREFFLTGDIKNLKPMILKDVAKLINMDISSVSRVTSTKYVQTTFGVFRLKDFFTSVIVKEDGEEISNKEIQEIISEFVGQEDKRSPLTDLEISTKLKTLGYNTARRTVAKYREHIGIPIARMRKVLM